MNNKEKLLKWNVTSPADKGLNHVINPGTQDCSAVHTFRLNLGKGESFLLESKSLEMNLVVIQGSISIKSSDIEGKLERLDSFYIPGNTEVNIIAESDIICYIGAAKCEGIGKSFICKFEKDSPLGPNHEIHGKDSGKREVYFTISHHTPASRLICGLTWGGDGTWTSWPPHQHEKDLEEVYCYFDMDAPKLGFHISYLAEGDLEDIVAHPVRSGSMVLAPSGYHPTVATPGTRNAYFWVLAAFTPQSRRYDLAILDPTYMNSQD